MGPPVAVMRVLAQQSLSLAVVLDEQVIEAVAPKRADDVLAVRVGSRRSRRRKASCGETRSCKTEAI
jgi:hypothetical protein